MEASITPPPTPSSPLFILSRHVTIRFCILFCISLYSLCCCDLGLDTVTSFPKRVSEVYEVTMPVMKSHPLCINLRVNICVQILLDFFY